MRDIAFEVTGDFTAASLGNGLLYLEGHPFPLKGIPTKEAVEAINDVKEMLKYPWRFNKNRALKILKPHIIPPNRLCPISQELQRIIPNDYGIIIAYVLHYDMAYRWRIQDLLTETTREKLATKPIREIYRLLSINKKRDYAGVHRKFAAAAIGLSALLLWPPFRARFKRAIQQADFKRMQLDDSDIYWLKQRVDYKYGQK